MERISKKNKRNLLYDLNSGYKDLKESYKKIYRAIKKGALKTSVSEWILDNTFLLEREFKGVELSFPENYFFSLPIEEQEKLPRVYGICKNIIKKDIGIDILSLKEYVLSENKYLTYGEVVSIPILLKVYLLLKICNVGKFVGKLYENNEEEKLLLNENINEDIEGSIIALRKIESIKWCDFFKEVSMMEILLRRDCSGIYESMEETSKDYYRHSIEELSRKYNLSGIEIAKKALELSRKKLEEGRKGHTTHIGYYIVDYGVYELLKEFNINKRVKTNLNEKIFILGNILGTLVLDLIILFLVSIFRTNSISIGEYILEFLIVLMPASEIVVSLINYFVPKYKKMTHIPKIDLREGIGEKNKTVVVVPTIIEKKEKIDYLIDKLRVAYIGNKDKDVYFVILGDFVDSLKEETVLEKELFQYGKNEIEKLNKEYNEKRFFILIREKVYDKSEEKYIGWERKRGKLLEFMKLLRGEKTTYKFFSGDIDILKDSKYLITLDTDTFIKRGMVGKLVGAMSHPLNKPRVSIDRVERGYGIMQPKVSISLESKNKTLFSKVFGGDGGVDGYGTAYSDTYQDLFSKGSFTGKGIIHIDTFLKTMEGKIEEDSVLSHDLLEGEIARCALVTDCEFIEEYPSTYISSTQRLHRWIRGDVQLIKWIFKKDISLISRWKVFDNIRRSLLAPWLLISLIISMIVLRSGKSNIIILFLLVFSPLLFRVTDFVVTPKQKINGRFKTLVEVILIVAFIPYQGLISLDAIIKSLYRLFISKKKLLEWKASDLEDKEERININYYAGTMYLSILFGIVTIFLSYRGDEVVSVLVFFIGILWILAPFMALDLSKEIENEEYISRKDTDFLLNTAKDTWKYYKDFVTEKNNYLPPDNYQEEPFKGEAKRTSPTNIGLSLMSNIVAMDLKFIKEEEGIERCLNTLKSMDTLERWHGHFLNWYNVETKESLRERYVSTVDSGNLLSYLMICRETFKNKNEELEKLLDKFINEMDFKKLFNKEKELFYVGYNIDKESFGESYYDLLASEARVASFLAIARNEVDESHWFKLKRGFRYVGFNKTLISWSGTMFEYLMPSLIMKNLNGSMFFETYEGVLDSQISYGRRKKIPFGMSEGAYYKFDLEKNYQYKAFGVKKLRMKREKNEEIVVTPYASILTLQINKEKSIHNLKRLKEIGAYGEYGFIESIDYTTNRINKLLEEEVVSEDLKREKRKGLLVKTYMVHHLGMSLMALDNALEENIMIKRFHNIPEVKATEILLKEKSENLNRLEKESFIVEDIEVEESIFEERILNELEASDKEVNILSNGKYTLMINSLGGGFSRYEDNMLYRWGGDFLEEEGGVLFYINDGEKVQSPTFYPFENFGENYKVKFSEEKAEIYKIENEIETRVRSLVSPEDDLEVRSLTIKNFRKDKVVLDVTAYLEPVINSLASDLAHMTFSNLFIETEVLKGENIIIGKRRKRKKEEEEKYIFVGFFLERTEENSMEYINSRERFIGRNGSLKNPKGINKVFKVDSNEPLDPCIGIKREVTLEKGEEKALRFILGYTKNKEEIIEKVSRNKNIGDIILLRKRYNKMSKLLLNKLSIDGKRGNIYMKVLREFLYIPKSRKDKEEYIKNLKGKKEDLWKYGISGDKKIIFIKVKKDKKLLKEIMRMHYYYELKGIDVDLVIYNEEISNYNNENKNEIESYMNSIYGDDMKNIFLLNSETLSKEDEKLLIGISTIFLDTNEVDLTRLIKEYEKKHFFEKQIERDCKYLLHLNSEKIKEEEKKEEKEREEEVLHNLDFFNGYGGFNKEDGSYEIVLKNKENTGRPWINVLANESFGCNISETGMGYTWCENSRENKITPWSNDYIKDSMGEGIWFKDKNHEKSFSIFKKPIDDGGVYKINHNFGYSTFSHNYKNIEGSITVFVPTEDKVKIQIVRLKNNSNEDKEISMYFYNELVLGDNKKNTEDYIYTGIEKEYAYGKNNFSSFFKEKITYGTILGEGENIYTCDKEEILSVLKEEELCNVVEKCGVDIDQCIGVEKTILLNKNEEKVFVCILGEEDSFEEVEKKIEKYKNKDVVFNELNKIKVKLGDFLGNIKINTGDKSFDYMMNGWLLYQNYNCRYLSRSAFYQSGGAYGFRDQMQDSFSLGIIDSNILRERILENSKRQYEEGDVQHFWHPKIDSGIKTKFSDDLLWMPYGVIEYLDLTGDYSILEEKTSYLRDVPLREGEEERYGIVNEKGEEDSIYNHCIKAIERSLKLGEHGIPLMGCGDWNDGMSTVGNKGKGESVWLGWFLSIILDRFVEIAKLKNDTKHEKLFLEKKEEIIENIEKNAWDGEWYKRAFFDDGTPLGSKENKDCFIDSISQSFSVIAGFGKEERKIKAMESVEKYLIDKENALIKLLYPPFGKDHLEPGYIKGYIEGVRENGGQYTHAAVWVVLAFSLLGENEKAYGLFNMLNPITHGNTKEKIEKYKVEPYVMAADVYTRHPYEGLGGWSYYTGAAGWMYKVGLNNLIGLKIREEGYEIKPNLPNYIKEFSIELKKEEYKILCKREDGKKGIFINGEKLEGEII
ncbi:MAG: GH36-type glycosyl hydrolase domain-containing protein, partial [Clostridium sp.]|uniref:GH36-type glycosyl hydrolase domain-containing protein n=1 Tax=Clostridium sp. TaxID=1506 RepID=UPI003F329BA3